MKKLALVLVFFMIGCGGGSSPTSPNCQNLAGTYSLAFNNSCQQSASGQVAVSQTGCNFHIAIPGNLIDGTVISSSMATFTITFLAPCSGTATGTATVSATAVNGTYSGRAIGCCDPISGSFTMTR